MRNIEGKRALVTGGAQGIGRAIAESLARRGAQIVLTDLRPEPLEKAAAELAASGARVMSYVLDVTNNEAIGEVRDRIHRDGGPVDIVVNNAGTVFGGAFLDLPLEKHLLTYRINTLGLVAVSYAFLPDLIGRPEGHVVNIASASAFVGLPFGTTYSSSKWAVIGFSEGLRLELKELGHRHVGVTSVCPSYVKTGLFDGVKLPASTDWVTPERLGELVVRAIQRNRAYVITPWLVYLSPLLNGMLPTPVLDWVIRLFGVNKTMYSWRGHGSPPVAPPPPDTRQEARDRATVP